MNIESIGKTTLNFVKVHSPEIMTGVAVIGVVSTAILAGEATTKAQRLIEAAEAETPKEKVQVAWKCYIPTVVVGCTTIGCIIGATSVNLKRNAALSAAYSLSETFAHEYKQKVIDHLGEEKEQEIRDEINKDRIAKNPPSESVIMSLNESDKVLCRDAISGRYFHSTMEELKKIQNDLNARIMKDMFVSLNDFYYELGIPGIKFGDTLGWSVEKPIEVLFGSTLADDKPCLCIDFIDDPSICG
ncbi:MAG: hypothetical protein [Chaetfec virus UA24_144]|nr:MAG: hypothetical protein [Chaetfec virus UA24_144]